MSKTEKTEKNDKAVPTQEPTEASPLLSKDELRRLFAGYDKSNEVVKELENRLDKAKDARSDIIKHICEGAGSKGPFNRGGTFITAVERKPKGDPNGKSSWFFKGPGLADSIDI